MADALAPQTELAELETQLFAVIETAIAQAAAVAPPLTAALPGSPLAPATNAAEYELFDLDSSRTS